MENWIQLDHALLITKNCCIRRDGRARFDEAVAMVPFGEVISTTIRFMSPSVKYLRQLRFSYLGWLMIIGDYTNQYIGDCNTFQGKGESVRMSPSKRLSCAQHLLVSARNSIEAL